MIYIYQDTPSVLNNWTKGNGFLLLPNHLISQFLVVNLNKYGIFKAKDEILKLVESDKKNISIAEIEEHFSTKEYIDIYSKPNKGQTELLFRKTVENISEGLDIYCSLDAFVLFIEWAKDNYEEFNEEIYFEGEVEEIIQCYGETKVKSITLNNLDKLIKLFCFFYGSKTTKNNISKISRFQTKLTKFDLTLFNVLEEIHEIIESIYKDSYQSLPANNIFNKVLEMLENLMFLNGNFYAEENTAFNVIHPTDEIIEIHKNNFKQMLGL